MPPELSARDRARQMAEDATARLAAELKAGRSDALQEYLATMGRFHRYSWTNTLLIHSQRPTATHVAGFHTWRDLGRSVRLGEKGIVIYAPVVGRKRALEQALALPTKPEQRELVGYRAAYVFDIAQTEGKPLPTFATTQGDPAHHLESLRALVAREGIQLSYDASIAPAQGLSMGGHIKVQPGLAAAEEFSVLTHELAHEMLHRGPDRESLSKTVRETQAEAVAYVVSRGIGLDTNGAARDYIALYNGDDTTLRQSLAQIQEASSRILRELLPREKEGHERAHESSQEQERTELPQPPRETEPSRQPELFEGPSLDR